VQRCNLALIVRLWAKQKVLRTVAIGRLVGRLSIAGAVACMAATLSLVAYGGQTAGAEISSARIQSGNAEISTRRASERKEFSDTEIADGFFKVAFGAELNVGGRSDRIRKYEGPVRIFIESRAEPDRRNEIAGVVDEIHASVQHLNIAVTKDARDANFVVTLVHDRDLSRTIEKMYGRASAQKIARSLNPQCLSSFRKDDEFRIQHSAAIIPVDVGDFKFYDCAYEEMLQGLGPINDNGSVPWTMFNDDVHMGFFDIYDQYLLNILYDPRIETGMTKDEVRALLPQILPEVRAFVAQHAFAR
jgi:hypothetical protein